jgi:hypothetical protein
MRKEELEVATEEEEEESVEVTDDGVEVSSETVVEPDSQHVIEDKPDDSAAISSPEVNGEKTPKNVRNEPNCAPWQGVDLQRVKFPSGKWVAPAGSYRSDGGGNKTVEAFEKHGPLGGPASRQAVTRVNVEQSSKSLMWAPTRKLGGEGRCRWGKRRRLSSEKRHEPLSPPG